MMRLTGAIKGKPVDVILIEWVDAAGVSLAAHLIDLLHHLQCVVESAGIPEDGKHRSSDR